MIDEPPRGAEGLQGDEPAQAAATRQHPTLGGAGGTPVPVLWVAGLSHVSPTNQPAVSSYLGDAGRAGRPGLNSNEERGAEMDEMGPLALQGFLCSAAHQAVSL